MSYRGRPSKGCEACRARKVKCDEARPACSRCTKASHECKYRDQADILFRNQTASAAQRAEESWRKRSKSHQRPTTAETNTTAYVKTPPSDASTPPTLDDTRSSSGSVHSPSGSTDDATQDASNISLATIDLSKMTITPAPNPDFRRKAFERFVYDFVLPDSPTMPKDEPSDALWTFIPVLYQGASEDSLIATTVDAVAYVNYANRYKDAHAAALGEECVAKAIPMLTKVIADKKRSATNEALCSVYLMGVYENLTNVQRKGTFIAHNHGATALLQLRTVEQYYSDPISARLYEVAYAQMLLGNLQSAKRPPIPKKDVIKVEGYLPSLYSNSHVFVIRLIWREAMLHAKWHEIKQSANPPTSRLAMLEIFQTAIELDSAFQAWESPLTPAWDYHMAPNTPEARTAYDEKWRNLFLASRGAPPEIHAYQSLKRCWIWGFFRTTRIFLLRDLLEILNWLLRFPEPALPYPPMAEGGSTTTNGQSVSVSLSTKSLRMQQSITTTHLVEVIDKNCSALFGSFTVPIHLKSYNDVVGMRGYVCLWPLGIMDAALSSGLVPDVNGPGSGQPSPATHFPTFQTSPNSDSFQSNPGTEFKNAYALAPQFSELATIVPKLEASSASNSPVNSTPVYDHMAKKNHIFDSNPAHPYDSPVHLPVDFDIPEPKKMDVASRREWVNRLLYYLGTELGLKKALYVPLTEGYLPVVKPAVDHILGR
ncbi:hypothetical protein COCCADRAFT_89699 [Bipolaris zeicola 26-R-13]|uniref:Zn(2)-C6 fungal-type domain-containing protein n=1 Tax=Cochliobolus carbonum (strain 26-R-13) TaxID=930089 RepID=W6YWF2_COCC2|nr:uncharacterized protein COCCADRAFT_89699 [Bipolaris zeicola 26-R-13]EUC35836.1 hypothetical protein COCCADRAFT_89699 [Bipolaris zeicola 26-R-13]